MIKKPTEAMLDKYATDSFIIELGAIPDNHDIRVEFSYFMELRKVKDGNEFETHRNYFQRFSASTVRILELAGLLNKNFSLSGS